MYTLSNYSPGVDTNQLDFIPFTIDALLKEQLIIRGQVYITTSLRSRGYDVVVDNDVLRNIYAMLPDNCIWLGARTTIDLYQYERTPVHHSIIGVKFHSQYLYFIKEIYINLKTGELCLSSYAVEKRYFTQQFRKARIVTFL